ncbi:MAG: DUF4126 domain-containing protein [Acidobacteriota bacterium]
MTPLAALQALSSTSVFAARAFLPLFVVALVGRFPELVTWLPLISDAPLVWPEDLGWLISDAGLAGLGALTLLELFAEESPDARVVLNWIQPALKAGAAMLSTFALTSGSSRELIQELAQLASPGGVALAGGGRAPLIAMTVVVGIAVFFFARWRAGLTEALDELDGGEGLGLAKVFVRLEALWAAGGALLVLFAPLLCLVLAAVMLGGLAWLRRRVEQAEKERRQPCRACGAAVLPEAIACPACEQRRQPTRRASSRAWPDRWIELPSEADPPYRHGAELLASGRCPACAERRDSDELLASEPCACGWPGNARELGVPGRDWPTELQALLRRRAWKLGIACALLGLVPVLGAAAALAFGRFRLAAPRRRHLGITQRLAGRWLVRASLAVLVLLAGFPLVASLLGPLSIAVQETVASRAFQKRIDELGSDQLRAA